MAGAEPVQRRAARYVWALSVACGEMRIIAYQ
jgi:hypothetical protein